MDKETIIEKLKELRKRTGATNTLKIDEIIADVMSLANVPEFINSNVKTKDIIPNDIKEGEFENFISELLLVTSSKAGFHAELKLNTSGFKYLLTVYTNTKKDKTVFVARNNNIEVILMEFNKVFNILDILTVAGRLAGNFDRDDYSTDDNLRKLLKEELDKFGNVLSAKNAVFEGNISTLMDMYFEKHLKPNAKVYDAYPPVVEEESGVESKQEECDCEHCAAGRLVGKDKEQIADAALDTMIKKIFGNAGVDFTLIKTPFQEQKKTTQQVDTKKLLEELNNIDKALERTYIKEAEYNAMPAAVKNIRRNVNIIRNVLDERQILILRRNGLLDKLFKATNSSGVRHA